MDKPPNTSSNNQAYPFLNLDFYGTGSYTGGEEYKWPVGTTEGLNQLIFPSQKREEETAQQPKNLRYTDEEEFLNTPLESPYPPPHLNAPTSRGPPPFSTDNKQQRPPHPKQNRPENVGASSAPSPSSSSPQSTPPPKQLSFAERMLEKQGYKPGQGLGKEGQGSLDPIQISEKFDRAGLGFGPVEVKGFELGKQHQIDLNEFVPHHQEIEWLVNSQPYSTIQFSNSWMKESKRDYESFDWGLYCDPELVKRLFTTKSRLEGVPQNIFFDARKNANPYEAIGKHFFMNRAALKMANLDAILKLTPLPEHEFRFADICAGPGGFTQYLFWRRYSQHAYARTWGWGFTLKGETDWKFNQLSMHTPLDHFNVSYGEDGTGNILRSENIRHFADQIRQNTGGRGLHLVTADGGASVEGDENNQESKLKQLVLCQFLTMFTILGKGGNFICKVFDLFTPFTVGLVYILYLHFERICILKPYTSRPANSERYVVAMNLHEHRPPVVDYLFALNDKLTSLAPTERDIVEIIDIKDQQFIDYIKNSSTQILQEQLRSLELLFKYIEDRTLLPLNQSDIKQRCLREWNIPEQIPRMKKNPSKNQRPPGQILPQPQIAHPGSVTPAKRPLEEHPTPVQHGNEADHGERRPRKVIRRTTAEQAPKKEEDTFVLDSKALEAIQKHKVKK